MLNLWKSLGQYHICSAKPLLLFFLLHIKKVESERQMHTQAVQVSFWQDQGFKYENSNNAMYFSDKICFY